MTATLLLSQTGIGAPLAEIATFGYHEVTDDPDSSGFLRAGAVPYKLTRRAFAAHLDAIAGAPSVSLVTDVDLTQPGRYVVLTFDDGGKSAVHAGDELMRRGWRGHFFIVTDRIGNRTFLNADEIRYLRACGHGIGSHSHTHPNIFREQRLEQMLEQWRASCDRLAQLLGEPCTTASVPGGHISRVTLESADTAGLRHLFTCDPTVSPFRVGDCWILGRYLAKVTTTPGFVHQLARFHGWGRARFVRRFKDLARQSFAGLNRVYIDRRTREWR
jgi:peptidoglycan/xylan/chitin deacetylase (PgdA/CDA1 family)